MFKFFNPAFYHHSCTYFILSFISLPLFPYIFFLNYDVCIRDRPRFFDQIGHQTTNASIENKHFSLNNDIVRLTKIMDNLVKDLNILTFKVIFKCKILVESYQKKKKKMNNI